MLGNDIPKQIWIVTGESESGDDYGPTPFDHAPNEEELTHWAHDCDGVDNLSIRKVISEWSGKVCEEMSKFQEKWLLENMTRFYGHSPSIDRLKVDNDDWVYQELSSYDGNFRKRLYKDDEFISQITLKPVYLTNHYFHYIIENNDGFKTEGIV